MLSFHTFTIYDTVYPSYFNTSVYNLFVLSPVDLASASVCVYRYYYGSNYKTCYYGCCSEYSYNSCCSSLNQNSM